MGTGQRRRTAAETKAEAEQLTADAAKEQHTTTRSGDQPLASSQAGAPEPLGGSAAFAVARQLATAPPFVGTEIEAPQLVHDAAMCAVLGRLMQTNPNGVVRQGASNASEPPGPVIGQLLFTGGTALSMCHGVTERYSEDVDFVILPNPDVPLTRGGKRRARVDVLDAACVALDAEVTKRGMDRVEHRLSLNAVRYGSDGDLSIDLAWRDDFVGREELLGVSIQPATSLLERFADAGHLPAVARGPHQVPCVGVAYIAATKLDAQHLRAVQGRYTEMATRARDLYDLAMIARSDHAEEVRAMVPELAEVIKGDVRNLGRFPRPASGYANSPAFQPDSDGAAVVREGYRRIQPMVYGQQVSFDEALDLARSLDPN